MVPQHLRVLTFFAGWDNWLTMDLRTLALETGLDYRYLNVVLAALEGADLLEIDHGRSDADPEGPCANRYRLTPQGRTCVPDVLRQPLDGNYALNHPMWSYKGYNMHGLVVALTLGPGEHEVGSAEIASMLGCDKRSAIKRLAAWAEKGWAVRLDRSTYLLSVPDQDPMESMVEIEPLVPQKAYQSAERKRAWVQASRMAKKVAQAVIEDVGTWIPVALQRIREAGHVVMEEFLDLLAKAVVTPVVVIGSDDPMEALRRRGSGAW